MDYRLFYDLVMEEEAELRKRDVSQNYRLCHALSAHYQLHGYLAEKLAEAGDDEDCAQAVEVDRA